MKFKLNVRQLDNSLKTTEITRLFSHGSDIHETAFHFCLASLVSHRDFLTMLRDKLLTMLRDKLLTILRDKLLTMLRDKLLTMLRAKLLTMLRDKFLTMMRGS